MNSGELRDALHDIAIAAWNDETPTAAIALADDLTERIWGQMTELATRLPAPVVGEGLDVDAVVDAARKMRAARERKAMAGPDLSAAIVAEQRLYQALDALAANQPVAVAVDQWVTPDTPRLRRVPDDPALVPTYVLDPTGPYVLGYSPLAANQPVAEERTE